MSFIPLAGFRLLVIIASGLLLAATVAQKAAAQNTTADLLKKMWSQGKAEGKGPVKLATFPLRVEDIHFINPMGMMASGHTTPTDHLYLIAKESKTKGHLYDVLAVADGQLVVIQWRPNPKGGQPDPTVFDRAVDLKVIIEHAATCWSYVDHLVELDPAIQKQVGQELKAGQPLQTRIPVKAGQVIGKVAGQRTFDFALIDTTVTRKGFIVPEQFSSSVIRGSRTPSIRSTTSTSRCAASCSPSTRARRSRSADRSITTSTAGSSAVGIARTPAATRASTSGWTTGSAISPLRITMSIRPRSSSRSASWTSVPDSSRCAAILPIQPRSARIMAS